MKKSKIIFNILKADPISVLFLEEKIGNRLLTKLTKSKYLKDSKMLKLKFK